MYPVLLSGYSRKYCPNNPEYALIASTIVPEFRNFIKDLNSKGIEVDVDHLIILNYLLRHREIDTYNAAHICQRSIEQVREILSYMENSLKLIKSGVLLKRNTIL